MSLRQNTTPHHSIESIAHPTSASTPYTNGTQVLKLKVNRQASMAVSSTALPPDDLQEVLRELPLNEEDLVPLSLVVDRVIQDAYARLTEMADTMPGREDRDRKRSIAIYARDTRKQIIKTYVLAKWARVADDVRRSMNITQFLVNHNGQFDHAIQVLKHVKDTLGQARLRNYDLLTAVDVLSTGTYRRLPSIIEKMFEIPKPLTNTEISLALKEMNHIIRHRLSMYEVIPLRMHRYHIDDGRVYFTAPGLFKASFSLTGREASDVWYIVHLEFLASVGSSVKSKEKLTRHEFPRIPPPHIWAQIEPGINTQLALHRVTPPDPVSTDEPAEVTDKATQPSSKGTITIDTNIEASNLVENEQIADVPLIRAFNLLQMLSLTYQLEILHFQALQLMPLGWADYLKIEMSRDRRTLIVSYWIRTPPNPQQRQPNFPNQQQSPPLHGGTLTISVISETSIPETESHADKVSRELEEKCKITARSSTSTKGKVIELSDEVARVRLSGRWEIAHGALGVALPRQVESGGDVEIDPENLDLETILKSVIQRHTVQILKTLRSQILEGEARSFFTSPQELELVEAGGTTSLRLNLQKSHVLLLTIDQRMGKFVLRDWGDLMAWSRAQKFRKFSERLNENPGNMVDALRLLKSHNIMEVVEQQVVKLGLECQQHLLLGPELEKLGQNPRGHLYIKLRSSVSHYLVLTLKSTGFKYALINVRKVKDNNSRVNWLVDDFGWLELEKLGIGGPGITQREWMPEGEEADEKGLVGAKRKASNAGGRSNKRPRLDAGFAFGRTGTSSFGIESTTLRKLYAFCCARVCHMKVEQQLKSHGISHETVFPSQPPASSSSLGSSAPPIPAIWLKARDIWRGNENRGDAAMENVRVVITDWWKEDQCRVVTTVKLKYSQPLSSPAPLAAAKTNTARKVTYDPVTSLVSFRSTNADTCIDEFLESWDRVERVLEIAREVGNMKNVKGWEDVKLLSFDLEQVELAYHSDYTVSIQWQPSTPEMLLQDLGSRGSYEMTFGRRRLGASPQKIPSQTILRNPHEDCSSLLSAQLQAAQKSGCSLGKSVRNLIASLRATLPLALELDNIRETGLTKDVDVLCKGPSHFRIFYKKRYALDLRVNLDGQLITMDATRPLVSRPQSSMLSSKPSLLSPIPNLTALSKKVTDDILSVSRTDGTSLSYPDQGPRTKSGPPLINLGESLVCTQQMTRDVLGRLHASILAELSPLSA